MVDGNDLTQEITQCVAVIGRWDLDPQGVFTLSSPQAGPRPYGLCVSNVWLSEGIIKFEFRQSTGIIDGRVVIGYKSPMDEYLAIGLGGFGHAYTITHFDSITGWKELAGAGDNGILNKGQKYEVLVRVRDKNLRLEIDGVQVLEFTLELERSYGQVAFLAWGETGSAEFSNVKVTRRPSEIEHVLVFVHGIRTRGEWQQVLRTEFSRVGIVVAPTNYGYVDLVRFLFPIPWFRRSSTERVWDLVRSVRLDYPKARISFLGHSFGTYIVAELLKEEFDLKAHRIVFCGSVVKYSFPFERIRGRFTPPILNEVSARDSWPVIAENVTFGYGAVGTRGFNNAEVVDRWHLGFGHSQYLTELFCRAFWIPFFERGEIVLGASIPEKAPWWIRSARALTNKIVWGAILIVLIVFWIILGSYPYR